MREFTDALNVSLLRFHTRTWSNLMRRKCVSYVDDDSDVVSDGDAIVRLRGFAMDVVRRCSMHIACHAELRMIWHRWAQLLN